MLNAEAAVYLNARVKSLVKFTSEESHGVLYTACIVGSHADLGCEEGGGASITYAVVSTLNNKTHSCSTKLYRIYFMFKCSVLDRSYCGIGAPPAAVFLIRVMDAKASESLPVGHGVHDAFCACDSQGDGV